MILWFSIFFKNVEYVMLSFMVIRALDLFWFLFKVSLLFVDSLLPCPCLGKTCSGKTSYWTNLPEVLHSKNLQFCRDGVEKDNVHTCAFCCCCLFVCFLPHFFFSFKIFCGYVVEESLSLKYMFLLQFNLLSASQVYLKMKARHTVKKHSVQS